MSSRTKTSGYSDGRTSPLFSADDEEASLEPMNGSARSPSPTSGSLNKGKGRALSDQHIDEDDIDDERPPMYAANGQHSALDVHKNPWHGTPSPEANAAIRRPAGILGDPPDSAAMNDENDTSSARLLPRQNDPGGTDDFDDPDHISNHTQQRARQHGSNRILASLLEKPSDKLGQAASSGTSLSKSQLRAQHWQHIAISLLFIAAWYTFSTLISLYNKWMFSPEHYNFGFPLFVTAWHMVVQFGLCATVLALFPSLRPKHKPNLHNYATKAVPCGVATSLDIGLSNLSLKTITLSFYTMCKSSTLGFVLLFAFIFKLEKPTWPLIGIISIITGGVIMMVSAETQFHFVGMMEVLTASCLGGLRWSLIQLLLDKESMGMSNPFATLFWLAPIMGVFLALTSMCVEGWYTIFATDFFASFDRTLATMGTVLLPGCIAFCMNVAEFGLIQRTSVVTLSVAGIFKEVATIGLSTLVFHDQLTPINVTGLCIALFGIALYNFLRFRNYKTKEKEALKAGPGGVEMRQQNGGAHHPSRSLDSDDNGQFRLVGDDDDEFEDEGDLDADADAVSLRSVRTVNVPKKSRQSSRSTPSRRSIDDASDTHTDQSGPPVLPPHSPALDGS